MFVEKKQRIEKTSYDIFHGVMMSYDISGSCMFIGFVWSVPWLVAFGMPVVASACPLIAA